MFDSNANGAVQVGEVVGTPVMWRLYDGLPSGVCVADGDGTILYANPHLHRILGYEPGTLVGLSASEFDCDELAAMALPGVQSRECRYRRRDGAWMWVVEAVTETDGPTGEPVRLLTVTDVSRHHRVEAVLRDQLLMKEVLFETLPVPVFLKDAEGRYVDCNDAFERFTGLPRQRLIERTAFAVMDRRVASAHAAMDQDLVVNWGQRTYEESVPVSDGTLKPARISKAAFCNSEGQLGGIVGVIHDLSKGMPDEAKLQTILEQSPIGVSVSRRSDGIIIFANTRFAELIAMPRDRVIGSHARDYYVDEQQRSRVLERLRTSGSVVNMEVQFKRADGCPFWTLFTVNQAVIQGVQVNLAWIYDYTERRNMEEALREMASKDPLTGIYNRRSFMEMARQQLARANRFQEPMSVMVLDVDHFKHVNDSYGHATGDDALRLVAGACTSVLREYDLLGRLGGEEFVIALPGTTPDEGVVVAERVRRHLSRMPIPGPAVRFHLTASIGIACIDSAMDTLEKAIHRADLALYRAKREGRNRVCVYQPGL
ncbi:diguanylate cyclase [Azospirillum sp. RWY-5-1]|uniref:Diguanylate cyclase n=2 Tax=Azospirillum oleiclasticum TaxID=2735135 RepID=A0ABX2T8J8_9PROT|nr:diguanylate cyclase [Azospirillum oleiclasticum]NYZ19279.1 diguanylate cyclase [Azospirillum oleiclasticum]